MPLRQEVPSSLSTFPRHPGLDPGSMNSAQREWTPDQVRGDEGKTGWRRASRAPSRADEDE
ncbi:hypothetical protein CVO77_08705 [Sphingopyxis lindanitolerans]|uniref:Uncharacterized protein n=1 Tax=Sphingopyxis lindanitolerans TaxID=2054227 RepID=A0A2S8B848_9SPHN|nr:hypothetical protein CVO77_08705 [Sphingopyxis lindanitolerans]